MSARQKSNRPRLRGRFFLFYTGEPVETDEMKPEWFPINDLPFAEMWPADVRWVPDVLAGYKIKATVTFDAEGKEVKNFVSQPAQ